MSQDQTEQNEIVKPNFSEIVIQINLLFEQIKTMELTRFVAVPGPTLNSVQQTFADIQVKIEEVLLLLNETHQKIVDNPLDEAVKRDLENLAIQLQTILSDLITSETTKPRISLSKLQQMRAYIISLRHTLFTEKVIQSGESYHFIDLVTQESLPLSQGTFYIVDAGLNEQGNNLFKIQAISNQKMKSKVPIDGKEEEVEHSPMELLAKDPLSQGAIYWPISDPKVLIDESIKDKIFSDEGELCSTAFSAEAIFAYTQVDVNKTPPTNFPLARNTPVENYYLQQYKHEIDLINKLYRALNQDDVLKPWWEVLIKELNAYQRSMPSMWRECQEMATATRNVMMDLKHERLSQKNLDEFNRATDAFHPKRDAYRDNAINANRVFASQQIIFSIIVIAAAIAIGCYCPVLLPLAFKAIGIHVALIKLFAEVFIGLLGGLFVVDATQNILKSGVNLHRLRAQDEFKQNLNELKTSLGSKIVDPSSESPNEVKEKAPANGSDEVSEHSNDLRK